MSRECDDGAPGRLRLLLVPSADPQSNSKRLWLLGDQWVLPLLTALADGYRRPRSLLQALPGLTPHALTRRLRRLEAAGLVARKTVRHVPPHVEYTLRTAAKPLVPHARALTLWESTRTRLTDAAR